MSRASTIPFISPRRSSARWTAARTSWCPIRATLFNLLIGLNGYTICSGVINEELNGPNIVAIPLDVDDYMEIGYVTHNRVTPGRFAGLYIEALKRRVGVPVPKVSAREPITRIPVSDR